jgi:hypothetical protein
MNNKKTNMILLLLVIQTIAAKVYVVLYPIFRFHFFLALQMYIALSCAFL